MININEDIKAQLSTVLPTYPELYLDGNQDIPCITYQIIQNYEQEKGNTLGYSVITVRVKVWAITYSDMVGYCEAVDDSLAALGHFSRTSVGELTDGDLLCWIMDYSILLSETYNQTRV